MSSLFLYMYLCLLGFALALLFSALYRAISGMHLRFSPSIDQDLAWEAPRFIFCLLAGPALLIQNALPFLSARNGSLLIIPLVAVAFFWSFCLGVLGVEAFMWF